MSALQETFENPMPPGEITGPSVWYGPDLDRRQGEWIRPFTQAELAELDAAMRDVKSRGIGIVDIDCDASPLPTLGLRPGVKHICPVG